jgi:transposase InsO family protein
MTIRTTPEQRRAFYACSLRGETYQAIANKMNVSKWCVRYWCRRQRDGGSYQSAYRRKPRGLLSGFDPRVRYAVLRLRLEHPRWGPKSILNRLRKRPSLRGLKLPSEASIGRYLNQWSRFRRPPRRRGRSQRPNAPTAIHQRWQVDFKVEIALADGTWVNLHTVRDPVGEACIGAFVLPCGGDGRRNKRVTLEQVRSVLRACFASWGTLPDEVQTDGEPALIGQAHDSFPGRFTLWLKGLGISHLVIRPGRPTDNAEVERCHRTVNDHAIVGNEKAEITRLQEILDQSVIELNWELPSRAEGCRGQPPIRAHPELLRPRRPFKPEHELALFDLALVDTYLATFTWKRTVWKSGQTEIGTHRYFVGHSHVGRCVHVRFDPADRHFVFYEPDSPEDEIVRRPAKGLEVEDLTGLIPWPAGLGPQQLSLPLAFLQGASVQ